MRDLEHSRSRSRSSTVRFDTTDAWRPLRAEPVRREATPARSQLAPPRMGPVQGKQRFMLETPGSIYLSDGKLS